MATLLAPVSFCQKPNTCSTLLKGPSQKNIYKVEGKETVLNNNKKDHYIDLI